MSNAYLFMLLALVAGAMMPTQAAINNKLAVAVESLLEKAEPGKESALAQ